MWVAVGTLGVTWAKCGVTGGVRFLLRGRHSPTSAPLASDPWIRLCTNYEARFAFLGNLARISVLPSCPGLIIRPSFFLEPF